MSPEQARRTTIIAEIAWGHNGSLDTALALVDGAHAAGADAVGIHLTSLPDYMVPHYRCSDGVTTSDRSVSDIYKYLERLSLTDRDWDRVFDRTKALGMAVCVMCNDEPSLAFATRRSPAMYALAAACFTELDFVRRIAATRAPVVLRIGGATLGEIEAVVATLRAGGAGDITLLHGIQLYPTGVELLNISALGTLRSRFGCNVGLADHIDGDLDAARYLPVLALGYGVTAIEKHITVDRALKHEDFEAALGLSQFAEFVQMIRTAERALGDGHVGQLSEADNRYRRVSRKRSVARRRISKGSRIGPADITFKRSDYGLDPGEVNAIVGRTAVRDIDIDEGLDLSAVSSA